MTYEARMRKLEEFFNPIHKHISEEMKKASEYLSKKVVITEDELTPEQLAEGKIRMITDEFQSLMDNIEQYIKFNH